MFHDLNVPWPVREGSVTSTKKTKKGSQKNDESTQSAPDIVDPLTVLTESEKSRMSQLVYELRERMLIFAFLTHSWIFYYCFKPCCSH